MAQKKPAQAAAPAKSNQKTIKRTRRNGLERKCLSKSAKRLYLGMGTSIFRMIERAEKDSRKKQPSLV